MTPITNITTEQLADAIAKAIVANAPAPKPTTMTLEEVGEVLHLSHTNVYALVKRDDFPAFQVGIKWVVVRSAFDRWLQEKATSKAAF